MRSSTSDKYRYVGIAPQFQDQMGGGECMVR
jgi:hypothetical protein